jgi:type IV fimbrial biogenesis protein FimT
MLRQCNRGLTLIEIMVVVALVAIMAALAAPSFRDLIVRNQINSAINDLMIAVQLARSEAIRLNRNVTLCRSADGNACAAGGDWEQGWIVFEDRNGDGNVSPAVGGPSPIPADTVLRVWTALPAGYSARSGGGIDGHLRFNPRGQAQPTGHLIVCHANQLVNARALIVTAQRPRLARDTDGDRIPETDAGVNFTSCI